MPLKDKHAISKFVVVMNPIRNSPFYYKPTFEDYFDKRKQNCTNFHVANLLFRMEFLFIDIAMKNHIIEAFSYTLVWFFHPSFLFTISFLLYTPILLVPPNLFFCYCDSVLRPFFCCTLSLTGYRCLLVP